MKTLETLDLVENTLLPIRQFAKDYKYLSELGYCCEDFLRPDHVTPDQINDPEATISRADWLYFHRQLLEREKNPYLGILLGNQSNLSFYGDIGFATLTAENLRQCIDIIIKFIGRTNHHFSFQCECEPQASNAVLRLDAIASIPSPLLDFFCNLDMAGIFRSITDVCIERPALELVRLMHGDKKNLKNYREYFGCAVELNSSANEFHFPKALLDTPLTRKDSEINGFFIARCEQEAKIATAGNPNSSRLHFAVKNVISRMDSLAPSLNSVADSLHLSGRTLRRRLAHEGFMYRDILDQVRHEKAKYYLSNSHLPMSRIAEKLGFKNQHSFTDAFKRWEKQPPSAYRKAHFVPADTLD